MIGSFHGGQRGAPSQIGFDHIGDDGARLGQIEGCNRRVHLVETLPATQKFGIQRTDLAEHLL
jgi:hypothetical protein